ncbi:MAG: TolB family protein, partial [Planctomycetota bacterium]
MAPALSPDGTQLAFVAVMDEGGQVLCVRDLERGDARQLAEADEINSPFWSPDGQSIGCVLDTRLVSIDLLTGRPEILFEQSVGGLPVGGDWSGDGQILFGSLMRGPLMQVDRLTGVSTTLLDPFPDRAGDWPVWPRFLPGGEQFLFTNQDDTGESGLFVGFLSSPTIKKLLPLETNGAYVDPPGSLLYYRAGSL